MMNPEKKYDPRTHVVAGALSGGFAAAATTPLDVIKTVLNVQDVKQVGHKREINGMMDAARTVYTLRVCVFVCLCIRKRELCSIVGNEALFGCRVSFWLAVNVWASCC